MAPTRLKERRLTRTHIVGASAPKVFGDRIVGREPEVGQEDLAAGVHTQDIYWKIRCGHERRDLALTLWFKVTMINTSHMAILQGVDDLTEDMADKSIATEIDVLLRDHPKEVALSKVHDEEDTVGFLEDAMESDNA
jgi:hypothetical protein